MEFQNYWLDANTKVLLVEGLLDDSGETFALEIEQHQDTGKLYVGMCFDEDRIPLFYGNANPKDTHQVQ